MPNRYFQQLGFLTSVCLLAAANACAAMAESPVRVDEGRVEAIEIHRAPDHSPVNGGTLIGGIAGGVIGHQIGSGRGNTAATIAGAIGGAAVGNEIERRQEQGTRYRVTVRLDSGSSLIVEETRDHNLLVGDRVQVADGQIYRIYARAHADD